MDAGPLTHLMSQAVARSEDVLRKSSVANKRLFMSTRDPIQVCCIELTPMRNKPKSRTVSGWVRNTLNNVKVNESLM
jgi:hypothetical protein